MSVLVLASASAARARILAQAGIDIEIDPAAIDEALIKAQHRDAGTSAEDCALALAEAKARAVAPRHPGAMILGADQILDCAGRWFDKPASLAEARAQLEALRGRPHALATAALIWRDGAVLWRCVERPVLTLRPFTARFLEDYLAAMGTRVLTTVGGYEIEGLGALLMARIEGDHFAIMGLPLLPLLDFLRGESAIAA
jgi:nucleoside triphosphate pyrophosphatase